MMSRTRYILSLLFCVLALGMQAQDFQELWATGSAVPEGTCKLNKRPDGQFRFAGALNAGATVFRTNRPVELVKFLRKRKRWK